MPSRKQPTPLAQGKRAHDGPPRIHDPLRRPVTDAADAADTADAADAADGPRVLPCVSYPHSDRVVIEPLEE